MLHSKMATLQKEMHGGRHQGDAGEESQGFREVKAPEAEGMDKVSTGNGIVEIMGCYEYMSHGFGSVGEELMEAKQIFKGKGNRIWNRAVWTWPAMLWANLLLSGQSSGGTSHSRRRCPDVR